MNNKKLARLLEPNTKLFVICMALFAVLSFSVDRPLGLLQAAVTAMVFFYARSVNNKRKQNVLQYIDSVTGSVDSASKSTLVNSPLPTMVFRPDAGEIIWSNEAFLQLQASGSIFLR